MAFLRCANRLSESRQLFQLVANGQPMLVAGSNLRFEGRWRACVEGPEQAHLFLASL
jgi:hypothetical protein